MNKKIVSILIVLAAMFIAAPAFAQLTGDITLTGVVGGSVSIVVTPIAGYDSLDIAGTSEANLAVATVTEAGNIAYDVTVSSANNGFLVGPSNFAYQINYTGYNGGAAFTPTTGAIEITSEGAITAGTNKTLGVTYTHNPALDAGSYSDTLTFQISFD